MSHIFGKIEWSFYLASNAKLPTKICPSGGGMTSDHQ